MQIFARQRAIGNDADVAGTVADLPGLANSGQWRQRLMVEALQLASTPHAFFEEGMEG